MKDKFLPFNNQRMPGIITALKPDYTVSIPSEDVNDLPFPLISPLGSHYHHTGHDLLLNLLVTLNKRAINIRYFNNVLQHKSSFHKGTTAII